MKKLSIIIIALLAILVCCKKTPEVNIKYVDVEREVLTIGSTTANIQCDYEYIATLKSAKLYYGRIEDNMNYVNMRVVQSVLYAEITGLESNTNYKYYYEFENGFNSMQSGVKTFTTEENPTTVVLPTVITADVTEITSESAVSGGEVISDGGGNVTSRGVCWSTSPNPAIEDSFTTDGNGIGSFVSNLTSLSNNTAYHVRAYATNEAGTAYGLDKTFTTLSGGGGGGNAPTGAINGLFTINENGDKVYFSQGNLQYQASINIWKFADNQWDYVGNDTMGNVYFNGVKCNNELISSSYNGWIDLFGWGTGSNPTITSSNPDDYTIFIDWGHNEINNGGLPVYSWRTLSEHEWDFVLNGRGSSAQIRFAAARVNDTDGIILLPDDWDGEYGLNNTNVNNLNFNSNIIDEENWLIIEQQGAVFLPLAGVRRQINVENYVARYWSSTSYINTGAAFFLYFYETYLSLSASPVTYGLSVRLVQDANK